MASPRLLLGASRALVGLGAWFAPDHTVSIFEMKPEPTQRFVGRLFGARELALAITLLAAPREALVPVAAAGVVIDTIDAIAGFDETRRGTLSTWGTISGPGGALLFAAIGALVVAQARSDAG